MLHKGKDIVREETPKMVDIQEKIKAQIQSEDIVLYMKGTKDFPQCGFSSVVVQILKRLGVSFLDVNVLDDMEIREGIKIYTDWPTIPQLYVKGDFIGGCDIIRELYETGELETLMKEKNILAS